MQALSAIPVVYFPRPVACAALVLAWTLPALAAEPVNFNRDIRPVISDKCVSCHGPDEKTRKMELRLDRKDGLFGVTKDGAAIVAPGNPDASALLQRITHADVDERMPPAETKNPLSAEEIEALRNWIVQGAPWQDHWAFERPVKPALPEVSNPAWCRNEIDRFVLAKLDEAGLPPGAEARKETLLRRVSFDLTGLPPTPGEVDAFLADTSDGAYETLVDRLLATPQYGERMAFTWLDAARYADTNGYQRDTKRYMWHWRDWVINAYNENMPFDQFTIEQLAGDLLPDATLSQKIATGFNRNHRINGEGGIIPEEYAVEYVVDRVATTSTTWMGLTMGCVRCHDHKFDPISQKEFYEMYAFFNRVPENGKGEERGNDVPYIAVPTAEETARREELTGKIAAVEQELAAPDERLDGLQRAWEEQLYATFSELNWQPIGNPTVAAVNGAVLTPQADQSLLASGPSPDKEVYEISFEATGAVRSFKLEIFTDPSLPAGGPGRAPEGNLVISGFEVERTPAGGTGAAEPVRVADAIADYAQDNGDYRAINAIDASDDTGWATGSPYRRENRSAIFTLAPDAGIAAGDRVTVRIRQNSPYPQHTVGRFRLLQSASGAAAAWARPEFGPWHYVGPFPIENNNDSMLIERVFAPERGFDPDREHGPERLRWQERPEWEDGKLVNFDASGRTAHYLHRNLRLAIPTTVVLSLGSNDAIKVWVDGEVKHLFNGGRTVAPDQDRVELFLPAGDHSLLIKIANFGGACGYYFRHVDDGGQALFAMMHQLAAPPEQRDAEQRRILQERFRAQDAQWVARNGALIGLRNELGTLDKSIATTMIMEDMATPRDTYLLKRGVYDAPDTTEKLFPSVPERLGEMDPALPKNRLGLAQWLMDPKHPLTARVQVNQFWQTHFGRGLVKTAEDFGTQGAAPSHPGLLDWLALRFIESGWDVKAMHKYIVMSATYRQSSVVSDSAREADPENVLLSRAPRFRLPAEMVRDQALKVSGLLNPEIGGPSAFPYQPGDLWSALTFQNMDEFDSNFYTQDKGPKLYRRGLYTYWKRTIAPPGMQIFDAGDRDRCSLYREKTNTPMQALMLLNDPTFVEAARHLAERMIHEGGERSADRIRLGYRLALAQEPSAEKQQVLLGGLNDYQTHFNSRPDDATALLGVGDSPHDPAIADTELAAYTAIATVMLNLDEIITRE
ncbi:MAG: PSD1 domain-containing protein [Candidatus Hydrogenedentes bacterium]|nr:PSD1 domain-containing protein [Candidatus Hydrogenedentota bacterium]